MVRQELARSWAAQVSLEDQKKALDEQYGGEDEKPSPGKGFNAFKFTKYSNAYLLVYVRKSDWAQVSHPSAHLVLRHPAAHPLW